MQKALLVTIGVVLIGGIALAVAFKIISMPSSPTSAPAGQNTQTVPYGSNTTVVSTPGGASKPSTLQPVATTSVLSVFGNRMQVNDFKKSTTTVPDPNNAGKYYLAGQLTATSTPAYSIVYADSDQSFNIILLQEPMGYVRAQAEQYLVARLGISQVQACNLRYWVSVPYSINPLYSGKNLGFSFCPGATRL